MKKTTRFMYLLLALIISCSSLRLVYANDGYKHNITPAEYAKSFIDIVTPENDLTADEIIEIYDENENLSGYCVSLYDNNLENGYVVIKFSNNNPVISEYSIGKGVKNIYYNIAEKVDEDISGEVEPSGEKKIYSFEPNNYNVGFLSKDNEVIIGSYEEKIETTREFKEYKEISKQRNREIKENYIAKNKNQTTADEELTLYEGVSDEKSASSVIFDSLTGRIISRGCIDDGASIAYFSQDDIIHGTGRYACSVVALTNLMLYFDLTGKDMMPLGMADTFNTLWQYSQTTCHEIKNGVELGGTDPDKKGPAAKRYIEEQGYNCTITSYDFPDISETTFNLMKTHINNNRPLLIGYNHGNEGHAVLGVGFIKLDNGLYFGVADGWNREVRYIKYDAGGYAYFNFEAVKVTNKSTGGYK